MASNLIASLLLVAMPFVTSSVLAPSSKARSPLVASLLLLAISLPMRKKNTKILNSSPGEAVLGRSTGRVGLLVQSLVRFRKGLIHKIKKNV